jgi:hypothetical protein
VEHCARQVFIPCIAMGLFVMVALSRFSWGDVSMEGCL